MDISSIGGSLAAQVSSQYSAEKAKTDSFQTVLESAVENGDQDEIKKACEEFESYFMYMMFKEMRKTVDSSGGLFPKSQAEEVFQDMLDEETANAAAKSGGIGLADMMYRQMSAQSAAVQMAVNMNRRE